MVLRPRLSLMQLAALKMNPDFLNRDVNANFSGGEKKRNEILQLSVLEVRCCSFPRISQTYWDNSSPAQHCQK